MVEPCNQKTLNLSIIPVSKDKVPFQSWDKFKYTLAPNEIWYSHFINNGSVGIITGKISQNLEIIDIDLKNDPLLSIKDELFNKLPSELSSKLIIQTTPNKGFHLIYRCKDSTIPGNQILAKHTDGRVIIETRGEGGYFCTSQDKNTIIQGKFDLESLDVDIPEITSHERNVILSLAKSLTRYFPIKLKEDKSKYTYSEPCITKFNEEYDILTYFVQYGWCITDENQEKVFLKRPDSNSTHSGYYFKESRVFFCFSSSTNFKPEKPYNHFQILQVLENIKDYRATLRRLNDLGFPCSASSNKEKISMDDIAEFLNRQGVRRDNFIQDITLNGRIIEEIDNNTLYLNLKKEFDKPIPRQHYEDVIKSGFIEQINPIEDFIQLNKDRRPNGVFEKWIDGIEMMDPSIDKLSVIHFVKKWYVGMVAQCLGGEFPNEFFLAILSIEQGIGKTTFLRNYVLPEPLRKYITEYSLSFDEDFKIIMGESILIIDDEMDGRTYDSAQTFKSILSQKQMKTRRKYDRRTSTIERRCSFAGSGNNPNVVRESQNRRIIPLEIKSLDWNHFDNIDYTDLFMEAYHLYVDGFQYSYLKSDQEDLKKLYENYVQKSDLQMVLEEYFIKPTDDKGEEFISTLDVIRILCKEFPHMTRKFSAVGIGRALNDLGYPTIRKGAKKITGTYVCSSSKIIMLNTTDDDFPNNIFCRR
ncbi:VapE domain-containing protein [Aquirufa aurantiipilula]|uniref:VapE family protein n=1 Tax=Aquirufa aurantiipilula TaxID=2696561 RepID=A0ABT6BNJ1_9BACT|nr:VapE domain-containing protein [Aquirufa aurantiipilula]MDF5691604.1 VapE family protein [Aquirufa aurantiipilula]